MTLLQAFEFVYLLFEAFYFWNRFYENDKNTKIKKSKKKVTESIYLLSICYELNNWWQHKSDKALP